MNKVCHLCQSEGEIKSSHIIPRFVLEWLINTTPAHIRNAANPNLRIQDGITSEILCGNCEQRLSRWEKPFAERIFKPLHENNGEISAFSYDDWALKFAASVSWRVLFYFKKRGFSHLSRGLQADADGALKMWSEFILDGRENLAPYEQHMFSLDVIEHHNLPDLSPYMNRYILRTVDADVISSENSALVYSKLGRIVIFGIIKDPNIRFLATSCGWNRRHKPSDMPVQLF